MADLTRIVAIIEKIHIVMRDLLHHTYYGSLKKKEKEKYMYRPKYNALWLLWATQSRQKDTWDKRKNMPWSWWTTIYHLSRYRWTHDGCCLSKTLSIQNCLRWHLLLCSQQSCSCNQWKQCIAFTKRINRT